MLKLAASPFVVPMRLNPGIDKRYLSFSCWTQTVSDLVANGWI
jgi:hypothetical protein